ncbi:hypothetical protein LAC81_02085 [Ensifer adhaerens]|uniref:ECs_2282 family putative zinc-binding protein n=1 Tax=Ensifer adhaerens TaxID=106592 RepID=UPI001CBD20D3|nr:hypothetical protein [Ensifer adhaerens]MBZ7920576.1 hypothetical protein [Ensifer adhaerens]UAX93051.1 hypothetical protein LAC78_02080 [Ensifer adhaerens]UAY00687.1 hypothetical protein LAC80_02085 [Ensifer adhaerens]UAY08068.1 hypothetical protein LAC81_02085 [Ensifer adhaerens]
MAEDTIDVTFTCSKCGPTKIELPDDYTDDDHAKCKSCGADFGPYGDIKKRAMKHAKAEVDKMLKGAFKGLKGWKVK